MAFTGNENHDITLSEAAAMTKKYRDANPTQIKGHYFGKKAIQDILNQTESVGIRIYYGLDEDAKKQLVVVGVNSGENDLYNGLLADRSIQCPPNCGISNPLNSNTTSSN